MILSKKRSQYMSEADKLLKVMEFRYGKAFASEVHRKCKFTNNELENVKSVFMAAIVELSEYHAVKINTLNVLRIINPEINTVARDITSVVLDDSVPRIDEMELLQIDSEIESMRYIVGGME